MAEAIGWVVLCGGMVKCERVDIIIKCDCMYGEV